VDSNQIFYRFNAKVSTYFNIYKFFDIAPNILYTMLFIVNCNECLPAEFMGQTFVLYKRIGNHFDLINSNNTSSDVLRPIFPNMLLKDFKNPALYFVLMSFCVCSVGGSQGSVDEHR